MRFLLKIIRRLFFLSLLVAAGWYGGAKYGAPTSVVSAIDSVLAKGRAVLTPILGEAARKGGDAAKSAAREGSDYVVGTVEQMLQDLADRPEETDETDTDETTPDETTPVETTPAPTPAPLSSGDGIILCKIRISNQPRSGAPGDRIGAANETTRYKGVELLLMPATKSCLSSGFGYRNGRLHRGVDYFSDQGGDALAGGDGVVVEAVTRSDYGNMLVIDHGNGVFTRYAHLARFGSGIREGASVKLGQVIGPIGNTGASSIVHLHYEVLTGDYDTRAGSFGLEAVDPYGL